MNDLGRLIETGSLVARIDRLPRSRHLAALVGRIAAGGWFEFYEFFMPGFILIGLEKSEVFTVKNHGLFDLHSFASFLASFFLGMLVSTAVFGFVSDRVGRRAVFVWSMLVYSVAQFAIAWLSDAAAINALRFLGGLAVGMQLINNDSFLAELTPRRVRGHYMTLAYVFILTAVPVVAFIATALVPRAPFGIAGWRFVVAIGALSGLAVWFIQRGLPESPRWLAARGRYAEADEILSGIEQRIEQELGQPLPPPERSYSDEPPSKGSWREIFFATARSVPMILLTGSLITLGNNWMIAIFHPYAAELFPTRIRAQAVGLTFAWSRVSAIFVGYWASDLLVIFGPPGVLGMIALATVIVMIAVGGFGPQTNGQSLEALAP
jgi:MFS transporter, putative metabolite:H+ symporter